MYSFLSINLQSKKFESHCISGVPNKVGLKKQGLFPILDRWY